MHCFCRSRDWGHWPWCTAACTAPQKLLNGCVCRCPLPPQIPLNLLNCGLPAFHLLKTTCRNSCALPTEALHAVVAPSAGACSSQVAAAARTASPPSTVRVSVAAHEFTMTFMPSVMEDGTGTSGHQNHIRAGTSRSTLAAHLPLRRLLLGEWVVATLA